MSEFMSNPILISVIPAVTSLIIVGWNHYHHKKVSNYSGIIKTQQAITKQLTELKDEKRSKTNCEEFRGRIGRESQQHSNNNLKVQRALAFLVSKAGGKPSDLDLD